MFNKKFKVRVVYFSGGKYLVEYAYYRFLPNFYPIEYWFSPYLKYIYIEGWVIKLFDCEDAEFFADSLNTIDDVKAYRAKQEMVRKQFYEDRKSFYQNRVPYQKKNIK